MSATRRAMAVVAALLWAPGGASADDLVLRPQADGVVYTLGLKAPTFAPPNHAWVEGVGRVGGLAEIGPRLVVEARLGLVFTAGASAFGDPSRVSVRPDRLNVAFERLGGRELTLGVGRQGLGVGSGFLVGDGVSEAGLAVRAGDRRLGLGAGQYARPWEDIGGARLRGRVDRVTVDAFVFGLSPTFRYAEVGGAADPGWVDGVVYGVELARTDRLGTAAVLPVVEHRLDRSSLAARTVVAASARGELLPWEGGRLGGELVVERGRGGEDRRAWAASVEGHHTVVGHPRAPRVGLGLRHYSGDDPDTPVDEAYDPLFQAVWGQGGWASGDVLGRLTFENTDLTALRVEAGGALTADQHAAVQVWLHLTDWGTAVCEDVSGASRCILREDGRLYTAGRLEPLATEIDLAWDWAPQGAGAGLRGGIRGGIEVPLSAARQPVSPSGEALLGDVVGLHGILWVAWNY